MTPKIWITQSLHLQYLSLPHQDDTALEKQGALFALAVSDIVVINMWCHDVGRENAANKPLLMTVFQVMMRLFKHCKTTLFFVLRDKTKTPLVNLEKILRKDMREIWKRVHKPQGFEDTPLSKFFNVEFVALPHYEYEEEEFKKPVESLRERIIHLIAPGGMACDKKEVVPASIFASSVEQIWKMIKENNDLDLPAHKVMVATVRCEEIANEQLSRLSTDKDWCELKEAAQLGPVQELGKKLRTILDAYLSEYDVEAIYFDEGVSLAKRQQLESRALDLVYPAYQSVLGHQWYRKLDNFRNCFAQDLQRGEEFAVAAENCLNLCLLEFDEACADASLEPANWDPSETREKLKRDICDHIASVDKLEKLKTQYEEQLSVAREEAVAALLQSETTAREAGLSRLLSSLIMDQVTPGKMLEYLADSGSKLLLSYVGCSGLGALIARKGVNAAQVAAQFYVAAQLAAKNGLLTHSAQFKPVNAVNEETSSKSKELLSKIGPAIAAMRGHTGFPSINN